MIVADVKEDKQSLWRMRAIRLFSFYVYVTYLIVT